MKAKLFTRERVLGYIIACIVILIIIVWPK
jgi:hypothetical protein